MASAAGIIPDKLQSLAFYQDRYGVELSLMLMKRLPGRQLGDMIRDKDFVGRLQLLRAALKALMELHEKQIIHNDAHFQNFLCQALQEQVA